MNTRTNRHGIYIVKGLYAMPTENLHEYSIKNSSINQDFDDTEYI